MTDSEWDNFVNDGSVSIKILEEISQKIIAHLALDAREMSVYKDNSGIIEKLVHHEINKL